MSCYNCDFFYQAVGDDTEVCQNSEVLQFDMIVTETSIYCNRWRISHREESNNSIFKQGGKSLNGRKKEISASREKSSKRTKR